MDVRALVQGHLATLQFGYFLDRRVGRHNHRLASWGRRLVADIGQGCSGRLGEDRGRLTGGPKIDRPDIERLQELRSCRKLGPGHVIACGRQPLLQRAALLEQHERTVFLVTDPEPCLAGCARETSAAGEGRRAEASQGQRLSASHHDASDHVVLPEALALYIKLLNRVYKKFGN
jgi:hypothetical protein